MTNSLRFLISLCVIAILASGCSVKRMAMNQVANALSGSGSTFGSDEDPELVRDAIPFGLKTMESLLADLPEHRGLLLALTSGFTQYSYAFVQDESDEIEPQNFEKAKAMRARAVKLFLRARDYGLRGLEVEHKQFAKKLRENPKLAVQSATREDVPLMYWTGAAWMLAISAAKNNSELMAELPAAAALEERALALNESWNDGSIHGFFISYDGSRSEAMGGSIKRSREHFKRAVELSHGLNASPYVSMAEVLIGASATKEETQKFSPDEFAKQKKLEFEKLLQQALAIDPNKAPESRLLNVVSQRKARRLLAREEDLFP